MPKKPDVDALIADLYDAAVFEDAAKKLPHSLAKACGAGSAAIWTLDPRNGAVVDRMLINHPEDCVSEYAAHFHAHDPFSATLARAGLGDIVHGNQLIEDRALERSTYYADFGRRFDLFHVMGAVLPLGNGTHGALAIHRPRSSAAFDAAEQTTLRRLMPHVIRSLQLRIRLRADLEVARAAVAGFDSFSTAAIVTDSQGHVLYANSAAIRLDRHGLHLKLGQRFTGLSTNSSRSTANLSRIIADVARGGAGDVAKIVTGNGATIFAIVSHVPRNLGLIAEGDHVGTVLITLRGESSPDILTLTRRLFGLTASEAAVAAMLASGQSPREIAQSRCVRISSVRTLLRRVLDKCDTPNLRELTRLLISLQV